MGQHFTLTQDVMSVSWALSQEPVWLGEEKLNLAQMPGFTVLGSVKGPTCCVCSDHCAGSPWQLYRSCHLEGLPQGADCQVADTSLPAGKASALVFQAADLLQQKQCATLMP